MYMLVGGVSGFSIGDAITLISAIASALYFLYARKIAAEKASHITSLCVQQFFYHITCLFSLGVICWQPHFLYHLHYIQSFCGKWVITNFHLQSFNGQVDTLMK